MDLNQQPPGSGGPPPNVLVAIDNSSSMDAEVLFPTNNGYLYWDSTESGRYRFVNSNGQYNYDFGSDFDHIFAYDYLFPNGCDDEGYEDRNIYCEDGNGDLDHYDGGVPPTLQFGFARSSTYNKAYFDPSTTYTPWIGYPNANPAKAYSDPAIGVTSNDLTVNTRRATRGTEFLVGPGMYLAPRVPFYIGSNNSIVALAGGGAPKLTSAGGGWVSSPSTITFTRFAYIGIQYFPATFYLPANQSLPANYSQYNGTQFVGAEGPQGQPMTGYQIQRGNFTNDAAGLAQYNAAIQNFANWYSYYRKRTLAIRGAVATAFNKVPKVRVAACTINQAQSWLDQGDFNELKMQSLDTDAERTAFDKSIYQIDFHSPEGTPNRPAILYLGDAYEHDSSIIQSSCQRNYAILFTDGFNDTQVSGIGDLDGDGYSNAMSDIATKFYSDLKTTYSFPQDGKLTIPAGCPDKSLDCNPNPHMTLFGVTIGLSGPIFGDLANFPDANANPYANPPPWYLDQNLNKIPTGNMPAGGSFEIDDLWHATLDSYGGLLNANSPAELGDRFTQTLTEITSREALLTNAIANSRDYTVGADIYQTSYLPDNWTGDLIAYNAVNGSPSASGQEWSAAKQLTGFTNPGDDTGLFLSALRANDSDTGGQIDPVLFNNDALSGKFPGLDGQTIFYLRGYRGDEQSNGGPFRNRGNSTTNTILGDIVHSVPTYVGAPLPSTYAGTFQDLLYPNKSAPENSEPYYDPTTGKGFAATYASRTPMVYVGANDGMLHGFDADNGKQLVAYVPNAVLDKIAAPDTGLPSPQYTHEYFVDGQTTAGPAFIDGQWQTMLVGGLRSGGRSIYALDVTNPSDFSSSYKDYRSAQNVASIVKWEYEDPGLGYTYGKPVIARLHNGQWAAIFGNGYDSQDGGARLYIVNLANGQLIRKLDVGTTATGQGQPNGLASPTVLDLDNDHVADYVYAGDFQGHLWKFDLTSDNPADWSAPTTPLFTAVSANGTPQPITSAPVAIAHPYGSNYGAMIYFGTGEDILASNNTDEGQNSVYGIWDPNVFTTSDSVLAKDKRQNWQVSRSQLLVQTLVATQNVNGNNYRIVSSNPITFGVGANQYRGWVYDLPATGEAVLDQPTAASRTSRLEFTTTIRSQNSCSVSRTGFLMALDLASGGSPSQNVFDVNGDGIVNDQDQVSLGNGTSAIASGVALNSGASGTMARLTDTTTNTARVIGGSASGKEVNITVSDALKDRSRSWREVRQ